jgi:hypothetical protein
VDAWFAPRRRYIPAAIPGEEEQLHLHGIASGARGVQRPDQTQPTWTYQPTTYTATGPPLSEFDAFPCHRSINPTQKP